MKKKILISILSIIILISSMMLVNAEDSVASIRIAQDKSQYNPGDTISFTITANCEGGISGLNAKYTYDDSILEYVSSAVKDTAKFSSVSATSGEISVIYIGGETVKTGEVFQIQFKVKENVTAGTKKDVLSIKDISIEDKTAVQKVSLANVSTDITIAGKTANEPTDNNTVNNNTVVENNTVANNNVVNNNNVNTSTNTNANRSANNSVNKNTATGKLPQTGINGILPILIITIISIAIATYASYKRYKNM